VVIVVACFFVHDRVTMNFFCCLLDCSVIRGPESRSSRFFDVFSNKIARTLFKHCEVMPPVIRVVNNPMK
jgi:hypothetical protein